MDNNVLDYSAYKEQMVESYCDEPHSKGSTGGGPGGPGGTETMEGRVAALEERLNHMPTKAGMYLSIGMAVFAMVGIILSVTIYLHSDLKSSLSDMNAGLSAKIEANADSLDKLSENLSYLAGKSGSQKE